MTYDHNIPDHAEIPDKCPRCGLAAIVAVDGDVVCVNDNCDVHVIMGAESIKRIEDGLAALREMFRLRDAHLDAETTWFHPKDMHRALGGPGFYVRACGGFYLGFVGPQGDTSVPISEELYGAFEADARKNAARKPRAAHDEDDVPDALERCIECHEQYCDLYDHDDPIHKACL